MTDNNHKEDMNHQEDTTMIDELDEEFLRKVQASYVIAGALDYNPGKDESPTEIISNAIRNCGGLTLEQTDTVQEMLDLAGKLGIHVNENTEDDLISDAEIDAMLDGLDDDDYLDAYDDDELCIVNDETGEEEPDEEINEVLSRAQRMKSKLRMRKNKSKMKNKLRIALKKHSNSAGLAKRARRLAIKAMKKKLAKKPLNTLSVSEKERIEKIISRKKRIIDRMALRMVPRVRKIEKDRLGRK